MPSESDGALLRPIGIEVDAASQVCRLDAPEGRRAVREPFDEVAHVPFRIVGELLGETRERVGARNSVVWFDLRVHLHVDRVVPVL